MTTLSSPMVMLPADSARGSRVRADRILLGLCVIIALLSRIGFISVPFWSDGGIYIYMGKVVATGGRLYQDFYETKFPGVGLMTAPLWMLFGSWWPGYVLTQTAMAFASAWLFGRCIARYVSEDAGRATLLFGIVFLNFGPGVFTGFQLETVQIFFATIAAFFAMRWLTTRAGWCALVVGFSAGIAAMIKPTGGAVLAAYAITILIVARRDAIKALVFATFAATVPVALVFAWTVHTNTLSQLPDLVQQIQLYGSQTTLLPEDILKALVVIALLGYPMLMRWRCRTDESKAAQSDPGLSASKAASGGILLFALLWLAFECLGILAQRRMYMYYFLVLAPPCAILFGLIPKPARTRNLAWAFVPVLAFMLIFTAPLLAKLPNGFKRAAVTEYLVAHTHSGDAIYCDWMPRVLLESDLKPGARYPHLWYFGNYDQAPIDYSRNFLNDLEQRRPVYLVLPARLDAYIADELDQPFIRSRPVRAKNVVIAWDRIYRYLEQHYTPETTVGMWRMYRRNPS